VGFKQLKLYKMKSLLTICVSAFHHDSGKIKCSNGGWRYDCSDKTVPENAMNANNLTTLVAAVKAAGLGGNP